MTWKDPGSNIVPAWLGVGVVMPLMQLSSGGLVLAWRLAIVGAAMVLHCKPLTWVREALDHPMIVWARTALSCLPCWKEGS